jgi:Domain of unknown function (DUF4920)
LAISSQFMSCRAAPSADTEPAQSAEVSPNNTATDVVTRLGAPLGEGPRHQLADVLMDPSRFTDAPLQIDGYVRRACSRKGCWMELAAGPDAGLPGCRVTFKDYGFFVPTDSAGSRARVQGQLQIRRVSPQRVAHYEAEGAQFPGKRADGSAEEVQLVASGVELRR